MYKNVENAEEGAEGEASAEAAEGEEGSSEGGEGENTGSNDADNDDDGDGQLDTDEQFCGSDPVNAQSSSPDNELDGIPDCIDEDDDNDGVPDTLDADPFDPNVSSEEITRGFPLWLLQVIETRNQSRP